MCSIKDPLSCPGDIIGGAVGNAASNVAGSAIDKLASAIGDAVADTIKQLATVWTKAPSVNVETSSTVQNTQASLWWFMALVAVVSVIIAGGRMAVEMRAQPLKELVQSLATLILVTGCGILAVQLCLDAGDGFSGWVLSDAGGAGFSRRLGALMSDVSGSGLGAFLVIIIGFFSVLAGLVQLVLIVFRDAILILLLGVWPLAAAATNTSWGRQWFQRISGWIVAFVLYKPAAALVYAASFEAFGNEKGLRGALVGCAMMILSVFALPALMRLCVPMIGGMGGAAAGGAAAGAALGAASTMSRGGPSGAISAPPASMASAGAPPRGRSGGPSGADPASGGSPGLAPGRGGAGAGAGGAGTGGAAAGVGAAAGPVGAGVMVAAQAKRAYDGASSSMQSIANEKEGPSGSEQ